MNREPDPIYRSDPDYEAKPANMTDIHLDLIRFLRQLGGPEPDPAPSNGFTLRDALYIVFRYKWTIFITMVVIVTATVFYVSSQPAFFESETLLCMRGERASLAIDPSGGQSFLKSTGMGNEMMRAQVAVLKSDDLISLVVNDIGVPRILTAGEKTTLPAPTKKNRGALRQYLHDAKAAVAGFLKLPKLELTPQQCAVQAVKDDLTADLGSSNMIHVTFRSTNPDLAHDVLASLVDHYLTNNIEMFKTKLPPDFFRQKLDEVQKQLTEKNKELKDLEDSLNVMNLASEGQALGTQISTIETNLKELDAQIAAGEKRVQMGQHKLEQWARDRAGSNSPAGGGSSALDQLQARLFELKIQEAQDTKIYGPDHPRMRQLRATMASVEKSIQDEKAKPAVVRDSGNPVRQELESQLETSQADLGALKARQTALTKRLTDLQQQMARVKQNDDRYQQLQRTIENLQLESRQYLSSLQSADISELLDQNKVSNMRVVQSPTVPTMASKSPRKIYSLLVMGFVMGLGGGLGLAFLRDRLNHSIKTSTEVETVLGLPVLIALPLIERKLLTKEDSV